VFYCIADSAVNSWKGDACNRKIREEKKLHQTKTEQNCVLQNVHVNVDTDDGGGGGGSGGGRETILSPLAAKNDPTAASAEL